MSFRKKLILSALVTAHLFAQTPLPTFEVASVKPNNSGLPFGSLSGTDKTRFSAQNITLNLLIRLAWNLRDYQVLGGPAWISSDRFDIAATTPVAVENDRMMMMLRELLKARFGLLTHSETRDLPRYALVVSKRGAKLSAGECPNGVCGLIRIFTNGLEGQASMPLFINVLSDLLGRPVSDETNFTKGFDIRLRWTPDGSTPGDRSGDTLPATDGMAPSFFTAIEEQLGLRLEPRKGPVETLTIDHAEKPGGN